MTTSSKEPTLVSCVQRVSGDPYWGMIECKFSNDEKYSAILVDIDKPELAARIVELLNTYPKDEWK